MPQDGAASDADPAQAAEVERRRAGDRSALERTYVSWVRTALALCALGFVVIRLGYYLEELARVGGQPLPQSQGTNLLGLLHLLLGAAMIFIAVIAYRHAERALQAGRPDGRWLGRYGVLLMTVGSVIGGLGLAIDLLLAWPR